MSRTIQNTHGISSEQQLQLLQDTPSVTVRVGTGEGQQSWTIQKKLLTFHSTFFAAALNGEFNEAITSTVELDEDHPQAFNSLSIGYTLAVSLWFPFEMVAVCQVSCVLFGLWGTSSTARLSRTMHYFNSWRTTMKLT
ncbi:hypothetical protein XPA_004793 [Xanthoria parietina]